MITSKFVKAWVLILAAGSVSGLLGIATYGWQHPEDTIGCAVWVVLAVCVILVVRRQNSPRTSK